MQEQKERGKMNCMAMDGPLTEKELLQEQNMSFLQFIHEQVPFQLYSFFSGRLIPGTTAALTNRLEEISPEHSKPSFGVAPYLQPLGGVLPFSPAQLHACFDQSLRAI